MTTDFINITAENFASEHLLCIIRSKKLHPGIEAKGLPFVFNNCVVFYKGEFQTVNLLNISQLERILKK